MHRGVLRSIVGNRIGLRGQDSRRERGCTLACLVFNTQLKSLKSAENKASKILERSGSPYL